MINKNPFGYHAFSFLRYSFDRGHMNVVHITNKKNINVYGYQFPS